MELLDASEKIPSDTTGDRSRDLLNHYATPRPLNKCGLFNNKHDAMAVIKKHLNTLYEQNEAPLVLTCTVKYLGAPKE
jgi:hypothetical protein